MARVVIGLGLVSQLRWLFKLIEHPFLRATGVFVPVSKPVVREKWLKMTLFNRP